RRRPGGRWLRPVAFKAALARLPLAAPWEIVLNPGRLTSPAARHLDKIRARHALGWQWEAIARELNTDHPGARFTGSQIGSVYRSAERIEKRQNAPQGLPQIGVVADPPRPSASPVLESPPPVAPAADPIIIEARAPVVHTASKTMAGNALWISDLQLPFTDPRALAFCQQVRKDYNVPITNIGCVGDELDLYWASRYPKSPD